MRYFASSGCYGWRWPLLSVVVLLSLAPAVEAEDPDNCLLCHQYRGLSRYVPEDDAVHLYFTSSDYHARRLGPHARLACTDCHPRDEVAVIPHKPVSRVDCTTTCHLDDPRGLARRFSHAASADALRRSVHAPETLRDLEFTGGPLLGEGQSYCLYCHDEPLFRDPLDLIPQLEFIGQQTFDRCADCHGEQVPVDVRYYLGHVTSRLQNARPPLERAQACAICHADPKVLAAHDLKNAVVGYTGTYHGKAALLGEMHTADCVNCHTRVGTDAHLVLAQDNPASITHPDNKADSCRSVNCHPGADKNIGLAAVHLHLPTERGPEIILAAAFVIFTLLTFGPSLVLTTLELFQVVTGRHVEGEERMRQLALAVLAHPEGKQRLRRFTPAQRWQHWILVIVFATLVVTGFPMKFATHGWARAVIDGLGGLGVARTVHHWAGVILVVGFLTHLFHALAGMVRKALHKRPDGTRIGFIPALTSMPMFVGPADIKKTFQLLAYLMFLRREPPTFDRFTIDQKFEYFGVFWGTMLLGVTGLLLWTAEYSSQFVDGRIFNLCMIAHTYEAFLAVIHVGILHICNVVFAPQVFPFSPATLSGDTPLPRLTEAHTDFVKRVAADLGIQVDSEVQRG